jgi:hypothetical protein
MIADDHTGRRALLAGFAYAAHDEIILAAPRGPGVSATRRQPLVLVPRRAREIVLLVGLQASGKTTGPSIFD